MQAYARIVSENYGAVEQVENALRTVSMFLPASVLGDDTELAGWVIDAVVNVMSMVHQHLAAGVRRAGQGHAASLVVCSDGYPMTRWLISTLSNTQIAVELLALRFGGRRTKWNVVCALEAAKAGLRLCLLALAPASPMLIAGGGLPTPAPLAPIDPFAAAAAATTASPRVRELGDDALTPPPRSPSAAVGAAVALDSIFERGKRTGRLIPSAAAMGEGNNATLPPNRISLRSIAELSGSAQLAAELLHVVRPVAFAVFRRQRGAFSWAPLLAAVFAELGSASLSYEATRERDARLRALPRKYQTWAAKCALVLAQNEELRRRSRVWFYVLLWNPIFRNITSTFLNKTTAASARVPLFGRAIGWLFGQVNTMIHANQAIHFYVSNS